MNNFSFNKERNFLSVFLQHLFQYKYKQVEIQLNSRKHFIKLTFIINMRYNEIYSVDVTN